jgi:uncharacterized protein YnzC (UPF0291/DUF896 family)
MLSFKQFITEEKNTHMTHLSDAIIDGGVEGTRQAINYLRALRDMLAGHTKTPMNVSTKWDGAPAVFAGIDPSDGKFFVAKKGIFNKNPKVYKTVADVDADTSGDLNTKLKLALAELPKLGIKGVIQGDFLYAKEDLKEVDIDGEPHITFHPNTIVYAVPKKSDIAKQILGSKIGVVWHTVYRGDSFESMSASFGEEIAVNLKKSKSVWSVDAVFKNVSGTATFTEAETKNITSILSAAGKIFSGLKRPVLDGFSANEDLRIRTNTFINVKVRAGQKIGNPSKFVNDLIDYINEYYQKEADKKKTDKGKQASFEKRDEVLEYFKKNSKSDIAKVFELYNLVDDAKHIIIDKLNKVQNLRTMLKTKDGFEVTGQEGFVAIDQYGKGALKLVDRLSFSKANFSPEYIKGWQR